MTPYIFGEDEDASRGLEEAVKPEKAHRSSLEFLVNDLGMTEEDAKAVLGLE